jgi:hypothetical protein
MPPLCRTTVASQGIGTSLTPRCDGRPLLGVSPPFEVSRIKGTISRPRSLSHHDIEIEEAVH